VGQVLGNIAAVSSQLSSFENEFILLDEPGEESRRNIEKYSLDVRSRADLAERIECADIVQIDWWNHPTLACFLGTFRMPPCRLVVYSHISGFHYPNFITPSIVDYADRFIVSTEYAFREHPLLCRLRSEGQGTKLGFVHSCSGLGRVADVRKQPHQGFHVGYIGTLDFSKLHADFVGMSIDVAVKDVQFSVYGQGNDSGLIEKQIHVAGAADRFHLGGYVEDIGSVFAAMDVLGYPLNPLHYGTGEQVLIESMGAGVPAVVMDNGPEKEIVLDGYNGLVASSPQDYSRCLEKLAGNPALVEQMGHNAKDYAQRTFSIQTILDRFGCLYDELLAHSKRPRDLLGFSFQGAQEGLNYFLNSLGDYAEPYIQSAFSADAPIREAADRRIAMENAGYSTDAKGSIFQYRKYFPGDAVLTFWCGLVMKEKGESEQAMEYFLRAAALGFER
jgi:glycosyltransferase involved in cell wall biosynthesis